jgi:hypothetical protein
VYCPPVAGQQKRVFWTSQPGTAPAGWSGTVTEASLNNLPANAPANAATHVMCRTDCSGFITSLFAYVKQQNGTALTGWQAGQENTIPEAGCFDPGGGCQLPNPNNYYKFFTQPSHGFQAGIRRTRAATAKAH